ncbi:MAG: sulfotransferase family protein [Casimicrobiaceae bacterium]
MADKLVFESTRVTLQLGGRPAPAPAGAEARDPFPVIVGCPRSGTSLLAMMLDAHPQLAIPPETSFLPRVMGLDGDPESMRRRFFDIVTTDRITISNWSDFGLDNEVFRRRLQAIPVFTVAAGTRAFYALYAESARKPRVGDKTPGYVFTMQHIQALLPEAHFIHVIRDPRDTAMSWRKAWFAPSQDYRLLGQHWRQNVEAGRRAAPGLRRYREVRFEDLVLRPAAELERLCAYLALPWEPAMLDSAARGQVRLQVLQGRAHADGRMIPREERTRIHVNLAHPPMVERVEAWRREMDDAERRQVESGAGPLLRELGYEAAA